MKPVYLVLEKPEICLNLKKTLFFRGTTARRGKQYLDGFRDSLGRFLAAEAPELAHLKPGSGRHEALYGCAESCCLRFGQFTYGIAHRCTERRDATLVGPLSDSTPL